MSRIRSVRRGAAKATSARLKQLCLLVAPLVLLAAMQAEAGATKVTIVQITVTVVEPPKCVINENRPIEVDFGQVVTTRIDGNNYRVPVTYGLDCKGSQGATLAMSVSGGVTGFDSAALRTSVDGLGIRLYADDQLLAVNSGAHNFDYPNMPALYAVPVKQADARLGGGEFTAAATLEVGYP